MVEFKHKELSEKVIAAAYQVHNELGWGFAEKVYKNAFAIQLREIRIKCNVEVPMKVLYHGKVVGDHYADMIIDEKIIVEVKAISKLNSAHEVQLVNYLKATGINIGLLINFSQSVEIKRRVFG